MIACKILFETQNEISNMYFRHIQNFKMLLPSLPKKMLNQAQESEQLPKKL